jgi:hypothetical protein
MSTSPPKGLLEAETLSDAWLAALAAVVEPGSAGPSPLTVSFTGFHESGLPHEVANIRSAVDMELKNRGKVSVETNAAMIFPLGNLQLLETRLNRAASVGELSAYYRERVFPRLLATNRRFNRKGTYFLRMISFGSNPGELEHPGENQIQKLLEIWQNNPRIAQSVLQLAIRDPGHDLSHNPRPFFPCLQQVSFAYDHKDGISVTGYYPTQYIFDRAYGNYLGLSHLGRYIAREMKKQLVRVNCISANPLIGGTSQKGALQRFLKELLPSR